jgi:hypothetical protein
MQGTPVLRTSRLRTGCGLLVLLLGTLGFYLIEGWTAIEAFYTTVLVVSTLGFSDLRPGRMLTVALIAAGVGRLYYPVGALAQTVIENQLDTDGPLIVNPATDGMLPAGDTLIVLGTRADLVRVARDDGVCQDPE